MLIQNYSLIYISFSDYFKCSSYGDNVPDYKKLPITILKKTQSYIFTPVFKNKDISSRLRKSVYFLFLVYTFFPYFYGEKDRYPLIIAGLLFAIYLPVLKSTKNQDNQKNLFQLDKIFSINSIIIVLGVMFLIIFLHYISSFIMVSFFNIKTSIQLKDISEILTRLFGTCAVLIAAYIGWQRVEVHRNGQVTDGFIRANEQLGAVTNEGKPQIETRLGGIYALEKIAKENKEKYFCVVINILTAYVRENSKCSEIDNDNPEHKKNKKMKTDISAIIEILRKTDFSFYHENNNIINLSGSYMPNAVFTEADLSGADLSGAELSWAIFKRLSF